MNLGSSVGQSYCSHLGSTFGTCTGPVSIGVYGPQDASQSTSRMEGDNYGHALVVVCFDERHRRLCQATCLEWVKSQVLLPAALDNGDSQPQSKR